MELAAQPGQRRRRLHGRGGGVRPAAAGDRPQVPGGLGWRCWRCWRPRRRWRRAAGAAGADGADGAHPGFEPVSLWSLGGHPCANKTSILVSTSKNKSAPSKNTEREIFKVKDLSSNAYKAVQFKVIDASNKHQLEKINNIENSIAKKAQRTDLIIDLEKNIFYRINKQNNEFKLNAFHKNKGIIQFDCKSCDYPPFKIEHLDDKKFNLHIPSQDEKNI